MFKFIKNLFKKEKEPEVVITVNPEVERLDKEIDERLKDLDKHRERFAARAEKRQQCMNELIRIAKDLGVVYKFRNTTTGEIFIVEPDDRETYDKMMGDRNMQLVFD